MTWKSLESGIDGLSLNMTGTGAPIGFLPVFATEAEAEAWRRDSILPNAEIQCWSGNEG